jgi:uncharacterized membrane protein YhaH (DUF805 family)
MRWMFLPFYRYAEFSGRSRRREYWLFQLLNTIVLVLCVIPMIVGLASSDDFDAYDAEFEAQPEFSQLESSQQDSFTATAFQRASVQSVQKRSCEPFCAPSNPSSNDGQSDFATGNDDSILALLTASSGFVALIIWWLASFIPQLAVSVRRLHDINLSGWLLLPIYIGMAIPIVGGLVSLVYIGLMFVAGSRGSNKYGDDPKAERHYEAVFA